MNYDLLVIGNEREGIERAFSSARSGRNVAAAEDEAIASPSLELLHAAAENLVASGDVSIESWRAEVERLTCCQAESDHAEMDRLGIERMSGTILFDSDASVNIASGGKNRLVSAMEIVVACGTRSRQPASFHMDGRFVLGIESLLAMPAIPHSVVVVGAGSTGINAAILLSKLGIEVTVVDEHEHLHDICGMFDGSFAGVQHLNIAFRLGEEVIGTGLRADMSAVVRMNSGRVLTADAILVCVGREGKTESLNLEAAGVGLDERGRVWCDGQGRTWAKRIVAVGVVAGVSSFDATRRAGDVTPATLRA